MAVLRDGGGVYAVAVLAAFAGWGCLILALGDREPCPEKRPGAATGAAEAGQPKEKMPPIQGAPQQLPAAPADVKRRILT